MNLYVCSNERVFPAMNASIGEKMEKFPLLRSSDLLHDTSIDSLLPLCMPIAFVLCSFLANYQMPFGHLGALTQHDRNNTAKRTKYH